jgi:hypothetical protein
MLLSRRPLRHFLSFVLCSLLLATPLTPASALKMNTTREQSGKQIGRGKKVKAEPAQPGAPSASVPDLDDARERPSLAPQAPPPIPSTLRSHRKPQESRHGRRVGGPLPTPSPTPATPTPTPSVSPTPTPMMPTPTPAPPMPTPTMATPTPVIMLTVCIITEVID